MSFENSLPLLGSPQDNPALRSLAQTPDGAFGQGDLVYLDTEAAIAPMLAVQSVGRLAIQFGSTGEGQPAESLASIQRSETRVPTNAAPYDLYRSAGLTKVDPRLLDHFEYQHGRGIVGVIEELAYVRDVYQGEQRRIKELMILDSYYLARCLEVDLNIDTLRPAEQEEVLETIRQDFRPRSHVPLALVDHYLRRDALRWIEYDEEAAREIFKASGIPVNKLPKRKALFPEREFVAGAYVINERGELLLTQHPNWPGVYQCHPGGHLEDEDWDAEKPMVHCIDRELREELGEGYRIIMRREVGPNDAFIFHKDYKRSLAVVDWAQQYGRMMAFHDYVYFVEDMDVAKIMAVGNEEIVEARFVPVREAMELVSPRDAEMISRLLETGYFDPAAPPQRLRLPSEHYSWRRRRALT